jgi:hypothetical protein
MAIDRPTQISHFTQLIESDRQLIVDYALGAAIIALLPLSQLWWVRLLGLGFLHYKLLRGVGKLWAFDQRNRIWSCAKILLCVPRAAFFAGLVWLGLTALGAFLHWVGVLAPGGVAFAYFWSLGHSLEHFYINRFSRFPRGLAVASPLISPSIQEPEHEG